MRHLAVSAIGIDRPGIVAAVTGVLVERGCNLEDTSMSILRGHFAMTLVVSAPDGTEAPELEGALTAATSALDLVVVVRPLDEAVAASPSGEGWTVSVYGADRPGIVHRVSSTLATLGVNITDLTTRVIGSDERPVYAMFLDVVAPEGAELDAPLATLAAELGVSCTAHRADVDVL
jgi:glycine cleavage system transcriptional repressor